MEGESDGPMLCTSIVPYFGAKRTLAARIVEEVGGHRVWWEPFCGSLAVTLSKPACSMETVNDLYGDVVNLCRTLADANGAYWLYRELLRVVPAADLQRESRDALAEDWLPLGEFDARRARDFFVASWLGRNGVIGVAQSSNNFCVRYTSNGGAPAKRWQSAVDSIPAWHHRLRNVIVLNEDGIRLCERVEDKEGTVVYCDPPYLVKGSKYVHDFAAEDHGRLAAALRRLTKTRVVVSYYDHPLLAEIYPGWRKVDVAVTKAMLSFGRRHAGAEGPVKAPEVLLCNW